ncbi:MAG TPA: PqqD family protein [Candidatus Acidoferrum sp.]|nr:PqqD family protein [Candidatus Acidoferrum sp.]
MMQFANRVVVPKHVLVRHLEGESVLLNLETEKYFGLDSTGTRMWELVTTSPSVDAAFARLLEEFEVDPELLRTHLTELLSRLLEYGLLNIETDNVGTLPAV